MNLIAAAVMTLIFLGTSSLSLAQLPDLSQFGLNKTKPSPIVDKLASTAGQLTSDYLKSTQGINNTLGSLLSSLGAPASTAKSFSVPSQLTNASANTLKKNIETASNFLKQKVQKNPQLTPAQNQQLSQDLLSLASGMSSLKNLVPSLSNLNQQTTKALEVSSLQDKLGLQGVLGQILPLTQRLPQDLASYKSILTTIVQLAQSNNIKIPGMVQALIK